MVIVELKVGNGAGVAGMTVRRLCHKADGTSHQRRTEAHRRKTVEGQPDHPLKSKLIDNLHRPLGRKILTCVDKAEPVAFRKRIGHLRHRFLRKRIDEAGCPQRVLRNIFSEPVQISRIGQIGVPDQIRREGSGRVHLIHDGVPDKVRRVVPQIVGEDPADRPGLGDLLVLELKVQLKEQLIKDRGARRVALEDRRNNPAQLRVHGGQQRPVLSAQLLRRIIRIPVRAVIVIRKNVGVQQPVIGFLPHGQQKFRDCDEIIAERFRYRILLRDQTDPLKSVRSSLPILL